MMARRRALLKSYFYLRLHGDQVREKIVENFRERMQLRRSLIELEDQNVQNSIEVSLRCIPATAYDGGIQPMGGF